MGITGRVSASARGSHGQESMNGYLDESRKMEFDDENDSTAQHIEGINLNCSSGSTTPLAGLPLVERSRAIVSYPPAAVQQDFLVAIP